VYPDWLFQIGFQHSRLGLGDSQQRRIKLIMNGSGQHPVSAQAAACQNNNNDRQMY
jgi:hypothetical protein